MHLFRSTRSWILGLVLLTLNACDSGGLDCPLDTPSCCYNALFGCGTFDLPSGCSCSQYGLFLQTPAKQPKASAPLAGFSGTWKGLLKRGASSCSGFLAQIYGVINVQDQKGRVSVSIPGYGKLTGTRHGNSYKVSGQYRPLFSQCKAHINVGFTGTSKSTGTVNVKIDYSCPKKATCSVGYKGALQKQR